MGRGSEETFFQRHADGQQVNEKYSTSLITREMQIKPTISLHTCQNVYYQKDRK